MRFIANENSPISELIKQIDNDKTSKVFHLDKVTKICIRLEQLCLKCNTWYKQFDIEEVNGVKMCWACAEKKRKLLEQSDIVV